MCHHHQLCCLSEKKPSLIWWRGPSLQGGFQQGIDLQGERCPSQGTTLTPGTRTSVALCPGLSCLIQPPSSLLNIKKRGVLAPMHPNTHPSPSQRVMLSPTTLSPITLSSPVTLSPIMVPKLCLMQPTKPAPAAPAQLPPWHPGAASSVSPRH